MVWPFKYPRLLQVLRHGDDYFRQMVGELTEEYSAIVARRQSIVNANDLPRGLRDCKRPSNAKPPNVEKLQKMLGRRLVTEDEMSRHPRVPRRRGYSECSNSSNISDK